MRVWRATAQSEHKLDPSVIDAFTTNDELLPSSPPMNNQELHNALPTARLPAACTWSSSNAVCCSNSGDVVACWGFKSWQHPLYCADWFSNRTILLCRYTIITHRYRLLVWDQCSGDRILPHVTSQLLSILQYCGTGCRSATMAEPLASSGLARCEAVLHGYGTSPLEEGGRVVPGL